MSEIYRGDLKAEPGVVYPYTEIAGSLYARGADTRTAFPKLTTVGGGLDASGADTRTAFPKLTTVGGWLDASGADTRTAFPKLTTVGGWLYASGADTRTAFPKLTTVGGWLDARGADTRTAFPKLTSQNDHAALRAALAKSGLVMQDGILSRLVRQRGAVSVIQQVGHAHTSYVVTRGEIHAHGATLAQARADLKLKLGTRDTSAFTSWKLDAMKSQEDLILAYRAITGACATGVQSFVAGRSLPKRMTVRAAIEATKGHYGHAAFASFAWAGRATKAAAS